MTEDETHYSPAAPVPEDAPLPILFSGHTSAGEEFTIRHNTSLPQCILIEIGEDAYAIDLANIVEASSQVLRKEAKAVQRVKAMRRRLKKRR